MNNLTVLLPVYNGMPYLPDAVDSILAQTGIDFRLLVIDDGSTDGTAGYLKTLSDSRVKIISQANQGLGAALNHGISLCHSKYLARMDADDISLPHRLEMQLHFMESHPDTVMLGSQIIFFCGEKTFRGPYNPLGHDDIQRYLSRGIAAITHGSCIFRMDALLKAGGYRITRAGEDLDFFIRMCETGKAANLNEMLYKMRIHRASICSTAIEEVSRGRAYALECAMCRKQGVREPAFDNFAAHWKRRSIWRKTRARIDNWSAVAYRNALIDIAGSNTLRGYLKLLLAAACRPKGIARRAFGYLHSRK